MMQRSFIEILMVKNTSKKQKIWITFKKMTVAMSTIGKIDGCKNNPEKIIYNKSR